jgi:hypothetical protein
LPQDLQEFIASPHQPNIVNLFRDSFAKTSNEWVTIQRKLFTSMSVISVHFPEQNLSDSPLAFIAAACKDASFIDRERHFQDTHDQHGVEISVSRLCYGGQLILATFSF